MLRLSPMTWPKRFFGRIRAWAFFGGYRVTRRYSCLALVPLLVGSITLSSCTQRDGGKELAQRWIDALNRHSPDEVIALLEPDATYVNAPPNKAIDVGALRSVLQLDWSVWKDQVYTAKTIVAAGNLISIEWHVQQTHPSGTPVPLDGATVLETHGNRIRHVRNYYNAAVYLQFLKPR